MIIMQLNIQNPPDFVNSCLRNEAKILFTPTELMLSGFICVI